MLQDRKLALCATNAATPCFALSPDLDDGVRIPYMGVKCVCWGVDQSCIDLLMYMSINGEYFGEAALLKLVCVSKSKMII